MNSPKLFIKRAIKSAASVIKNRTVFPAVKPGAVNIFGYHRVAADITRAEQESFYGIVISTETFRRHCELMNNAYEVISLETVPDFLSGRRTAARPLAVITFDDGYLDVYEQAFPVLHELDLPATVFLPTECIGHDKPLAHDRLFWLLKQCFEREIPLGGLLANSGMKPESANEFAASRDRLGLTEKMVHLPSDLRENIIRELERELGDFSRYPREYQLLDWEMIREMSQRKISFGGHTANHVVLSLEKDSAMTDEIYSSKQKLERELGIESLSFAYPNGEYNAKIRRIIADAGYKIAVTTEKKINYAGADLLSLGRTSLCEESTRGIGGIYSPKVAALRLGI